MSQINTTSSTRASTSSSNTHAIGAATRAPHRSSDNFNVQYLVLEALCPMWPSYSDLIAAASTTTSVATAPSQCDEQLMAIFTKSVPSTDAKRRQHSTDDDVAVQAEAAAHRNLRFECSRMGVNLLMLGRWSLHEASTTSKSSLQWHVTVPHPLHGAGGPRVSFRVLECVPPLPPPPRATVTSTAATVGPASLHGARVMFPDNTSLEACVFVYPKDYSHLCVQQRRKSGGSVWRLTSDELRGASLLEEDNAKLQKLPAASTSDTYEQHNEVVDEPWVRSVQRELLQSVRWLTAATNDDDAGVPSNGSCGLLVHGPSGVGKTHQLQQLLASLPDVVCVAPSKASAKEIQQDRPVRLETRYVQVPSLFELSGHPTDAAKSLCAMIRPSFVSIPSGARSIGGGSGYFGIVNGHVCSKRLLVVVLDDVDALRADSEELFVMTAAHSLAETLEQQRCAHKECDDDDDVDQRYSTNEAVVVIGVTSNASAVHPILCSSRALMSRVIEATPPSVTLRRHLYHQHDLLLRASQSTTTLSTISPSQSPSSVVDVLSNWLELTSGWIVPRILGDLAFHMNRKKDDGPKNKAQHHVPNSIEQQQGREGSHSLSSMIGVDGIVDKIERLLLFPFRHRQSLARSGVVCPKGALIVGPSGVGKTALLAALHSELRHQRDVAQDGHQQQANKLHVIMVDALSLLHKEVGRSEKNIQALLAEARASSPSVVFLDNLDAIAPPRGKNTRETNITADRTLSTLLVELDGVRDHRDAEVLVVASAPSVESLDAAMVRPGRLDLHLELQLPTADVMAQLIVDRLFLANPDVLQLEDGVDIGTAQTEVRRIVLDRAASVGRSLTYADGVAAVRAVALHALSGCGGAAPATRISLQDLTDVVAEALTQR